MFEFIASFILWIILKVGQWFPFKSQSTNLAKYQGHCYAKREEAVWSLLFLNNNDPVFCILLFEKSRVPDILKVPDPKKISGRPDILN